MISELTDTWHRDYQESIMKLATFGLGGIHKMPTLNNLTGMRFGRLVVIERDNEQSNIGKKRTYWVCQCDCGNTKAIQADSLTSGKSTSCGCYRKEAASLKHTVDLTGKRYGRLTVRSRDLDRQLIGKHYYIVQCDCGTIKSVSGGDLRIGDTLSCGCLQREKASLRMTGVNKTHGLSHHPEYTIWMNMMGRCYDSSNRAYPNYGGRGIKVFEKWHVFENFYEDVLAEIGPRESNKYTFDRIDNSKGYEPGNIRWATYVEQCNNTRKNVYLTHNGQTLTISQWSRVLNIPSETIRLRKLRGLSDEKSLALPVRNPH